MDLRRRKATKETAQPKEVCKSPLYWANLAKQSKANGAAAKSSWCKQQGVAQGKGLERASVFEKHAGKLPTKVTYTGTAKRKGKLVSRTMEPAKIRAPKKQQDQAKRRPCAQAAFILSQCQSIVYPYDLHAAQMKNGELSLVIDTSKRKHKKYKTTAEQLLMEVPNLTYIKQPKDTAQTERTAVGVTLRGDGLDEETSAFWLEYLKVGDLVGADQESFGTQASRAYHDVHKLAKSFHNRGVNDASTSNDKFVADAKSLEIGFSTQNGGSDRQKEANHKGHAFSLNNNKLTKQAGDL